MKYSYKDIKKSFPKEKERFESSFSRVFHIRPISFLVTVPLVNRGITPYAISVLSIYVALMSFLFLCIPTAVTRVIGGVLVPIWNILDCVDGNIARTTNKFAKYGSVIDAISGYYINALLPIGLGVAAFNIGDNYLGISPVFFLFIGGVGAIGSTLSRLIHQKYVNEVARVDTKEKKYIENDSNSAKSKVFDKYRKLIGIEIELTGIPMFFLLLAPVFNLYHLLACYYGVSHILSLFLFTFYYSRKCKE